MRSIIAILYFASCCVIGGRPAKILGIFMTPSYSHQVVYQPIWKELSLRGHQVTVLTSDPLHDPTLTNLTEIDMSFSYEVWKGDHIESSAIERRSMLDEVRKFSKAYNRVSDAWLAHRHVRELIRDKNRTFDLLLVEYLFPSMYAFKDIFNCPMVGVTSLGLTPLSNYNLGNPQNPVIAPDFTLPFSRPATFFQRLISAAYDQFYKFVARRSLLKRLDASNREYFGNDVRSLSEIARETSLVIVNRNLAIRNPMPQSPNVIDISGIHIKPKKPLPKGIKDFLDNSTEGVVYFSLGSNVKSIYMPQEKKDLIMTAFANLPYKILWKFEDDQLPNKPHNVKISKWLPQQDVLGHPNIKLFISQGGLQSLDEAIFNKVPLLFIPFFGDQKYNADHMVRRGAALMLDFHSMTSDDLRSSVLEVIENSKYQKAINKMSAIASDQPMAALEKAVWWIEYVLRHDGAMHLTYVGRDVPFYQYYMLDIVAFLILSLVIVAFFTYFSVKYVVRLWLFIFGLFISRQDKEKSA